MIADDIREDLDALAQHVAKEATKSKTLPESIDALKALTAYYSAVVKAKGKDGEDASEGPNFGAFQSSIAGAEEHAVHGRAEPLPGRRRDS